MMEFKKIVVAVDLDPASIKTLSQLNNLNINDDTEVHLIHVFEFNLVNFEFIPLFNPSKNDFLMIEKLMLEKLEVVKSDLGLKTNPKFIIKCLTSPNAKQEFLQYVDQVQPDLVVAASQEKQGLKGFFEGSFTSYLTRFSRANLLIFRPVLDKVK